MLVRAVARITFLTALLAVTATLPSKTENTAAVNQTTTIPDLLPDAIVTQTFADGAAILRIDGIITKQAEQRFIHALQSLPRSLPMVIELSSPGGFTSAGYRMIDMILTERGNGRSITTRVRGREACESMCVGIFLAGYPRYAAPSAEFMVHAPRLIEDGQMTLRTTTTMINRLISLGASPNWVEHVKAAGGFSGRVDYRESAASLIATNANVVTHLTR